MELKDVPVGGRFVESVADIHRRRYYVVLKHFNGWRLEEGEDGKMRKVEGLVVQKTRMKYISHFETVSSSTGDSEEPVWVQSVRENDRVHVMYLEDYGE